MAAKEIPCKIRMQEPEVSGGDVSDEQTSASPLEIKKMWATEIMKHFNDKDGRHNRIRPWDFVLGLDGSVSSFPVSLSEVDPDAAYPPRFQIPQGALHGLSQEDKVRRAEMFAMGSLLYEIISGKKPFEELTDEAAQTRFSKGQIPRDTIQLPLSLFILSAWNEEFSQLMKKEVRAQGSGFFHSAIAHAKAHPYLAALKVTGAALAAVSVFTVPLLGAIGFTAAGPAAGSAAAAWQSYLGLVQAGSLFSWCQSVAMGGAALGGIQAAGAVGAALMSVDKIPGMVDKVRTVFLLDEQT